MPIQPIDLQILFSQMNQVGKEQAVQKDIPPQAQYAQATEIVKKTEQNDASVNQSRDVEEGPEKVREEERRSRRRRGRREEAGEKPVKEAGTRPYFQDPDLGKHVDLTG